jgi:hypothetical protein
MRTIRQAKQSAKHLASLERFHLPPLPQMVWLWSTCLQLLSSLESHDPEGRSVRTGQQEPFQMNQVLAPF